ncbi:MAG: hypothetical protein ACI4SB_02300 [Acutalibacteraceae bacterium]
MTDDTIHLLKECDSGTKTAVNSIKQMLDNVKSTELLNLLTDSLKVHEKIGDELHSQLNELGESGKDPSGAARISAWAKINLSLLNDDSDKTVASLMTDGCNMGVKQLGVYKNKYPTADKESQKLVEKLISEETKLVENLRPYL